MLTPIFTCDFLELHKPRRQLDVTFAGAMSPNFFWSRPKYCPTPSLMIQSKNTPGKAGGPGGRDRTLAVESRKNVRKITFFSLKN